MMKLSPEEFREALKKGLGRTVRHVRTSESFEVRDDLLHAALSALAYDPQCEMGRIPWLMEMFRISGEPDFYRRRILDRLLELAETDERDSHEFWQLYQLAAEFALAIDNDEKSRKEAREVIYEVFGKMIHDRDMLGGKELVRIDGIEGLLHVLRQIGRRILDRFEFEDAKYVIESTEKIFGKEKLNAAIQAAAIEDSLIQIYLDRAESDDPWFDTPFYYPIRQLPDLPLRGWVDRILEDKFDDFKDYGDDYHPYFWLTSRRSAISKASWKVSQDDLSYALNMLLDTTDPRRQFCILGAFLRNPMPQIEREVIDLVDSDNVSLRWCAGQALSESSHELIRKKALELLNSERPNWDTGIGMLKKSFRSGDQKIIETAILRREFTSVYDLHSAGLNLSTLIKRNPEEPFHDLCCWFYEQTPCTNCRENFVRYLFENGSMPSEMAEECRDDCSSEIRKLLGISRY